MDHMFTSNSTLLWIWQQWEQVNKSATLGRLSAPVFQVHRGSSRLGYWQQVSRIMSFSEQLLEDGTEYEFDLVLRHEMAHQFADEILKAEGERPHGDAFAYACEIMGIHRFSRMKLSSKENKAALKIQKLLRLAMSSNPHEAELAARRAQQLMVKHQVGEEVTNYVFHHLSRFGSRRRAADRRLISLLTRHFSIYSIWIQSPKIENEDFDIGAATTHAWHIEIMGLRHHVEIACYTFEFLSREMERRWRDFRKKERTYSGDKRSFQLGLLAGLDKKLSGTQLNDKEVNAVVPLHKKGLIAFVEARYPKLSHRRARGTTMSSRYHDGFHQGVNLKLHEGVKKGYEPLRLSK